MPVRHCAKIKRGSDTTQNTLKNCIYDFQSDYINVISGTDFSLFETWGQTSVAHAYFIENIIMLIPFGILAPIVLKQMRKIRLCVLTGFLLSCGIEISQLITQRGYCQLDDVVTNTAGTLIGWTIWKGFGRIITIKKTNEESIKK